MAQRVNYEPSVDASALEQESMACYQTHGLEATITCIPLFLLSAKVGELYRNLTRSRDGSVTSTATLVKSTGEEVPFTFDVRAAVRSLFSLPHEGDSILTLTIEEVRDAMRKILIQGDVTSTIYMRDIKEAVKPPIKVLKATFIGMLGSRNQVSLPQQRLLTALFGDYMWKWEEAFLNILLEAAKTPQIRLGCKVLALIIHAAKDKDSSWPNQLDYTLALLSLKEKSKKEKASKEKATKKKAVSKKAAAKATTESSSSSSEGSGSQPRPATTQPTQTPSTPSSSKWKAIPRPRGNVSSTSPSPQTPTRTHLPSEAELTSALASSFPSEVELTSTSVSQATKIGLTPVSASAQLLPHTDLSPVPEEVEEEEEDTDEETTSDYQIIGEVDSHDILLQSAQREKDSLSQWVFFVRGCLWRPGTI